MPPDLREAWLGDAANPPRYAPVTSGDHLLAKLMGPRLLRPSEPSRRT
jgi:hypothetical protein